MKILAAADLHGDTSLAKRLAKKAERENVDYVVLCGDLTLAEKSISGIIGPFVKKNKKVIFVPGNHESFATADFLADLYSAVNLHGYSISIGDTGLFGCGAANIGPSKLTESEIFNILKKSFTKIKDKKKKIMITHVHPSGTLVEKLSNYVSGSTGVKKAIDTLKPDILLCSHIHEAEGIEEKVGKTKVINVGRNGKIIII